MSRPRPIYRTQLLANVSAFADPRLRPVLKYLHEHLADLDRLPLAKAACMAHLSPEHFSRFFRQRTGIGFGAWQTAYRMERAKCLLLQSRLPISSVGLAVGYGDATTFGRAFKRHKGLTPRQLRKLNYRNPGLHSALQRLRWPGLVLDLCLLGDSQPGFLVFLRLAAKSLSGPH